MPFWEVAGSVLGGVLGKSKGIRPSESMVSHVKGVMQASEKYGVSPLTLFGVQNPGHYGPDNSSMGAGIADAAMFMGDALARKSNAAKLQQVASERDRLQEKVVDLTIRPQVPGIYGMPRMGGPNGPGQTNLGAVSVRNDGLGPVTAGQLGYDPTRPVDHKPLQDVPLEVVAEAPDGVKMRIFTSPDGEILQPWEYPTVGGAYAGASLAAQAKIAGVDHRNPLNLLSAPFWPKTGVLNPWNYTMGEKPKPKPKAKAKPKKGADYWTHPQTGFTAKPYKGAYQ